jgi:trans-2-enoyl-CoA reductase
MSVGASTPRSAGWWGGPVVRAGVVASIMALTACASFGGVVRTRANVVGGVITEDEMRMTVDTVVRNACEEMADFAPEQRGVVSVRISQDAFDNQIVARVVKSSGNEHIDATVADLASLLPPRFRDKAQQVYTPRYDMAVGYTCVRDAYGVTGKAAISL